MRKIKKQELLILSKKVVHKLLLAFLMSCFVFLSLLIVYAVQTHWFEYKAHQIELFTDTVLRKMGFQINKDIFIRGNVRTSQNEIRRMLAIDENALITSLDLEMLRSRLKLLPWIKEALIQRKLPNILTIELFEHQPIALWQTRDKYFPIVENGNWINLQESKNEEDLPIIVGKGAPKATPVLLQELKEFALIRDRIVGAKYINQKRWRLYIDDFEEGIEVELPEGDLASSLSRLSKLEEKEYVFEKEIKKLDLRTADKVIVELISIPIENKPVITRKKK